MTPSRDHAHRRKEGVVKCACGALDPTIEHISWKCRLFATQRAPALQKLPRLHRLPICFRMCTLVPKFMNISKEDLEVVQNSLVQVWQAHIEQWAESNLEQAYLRCRLLRQSNLAYDGAGRRAAGRKEGPRTQTDGRRWPLLRQVRKKHEVDEAPEPQDPEKPLPMLDGPGYLRSNNRIQQPEEELSRKYSVGGHDLESSAGVSGPGDIAATT